jgi:hypothetical protein
VTAGFHLFSSSKIFIRLTRDRDWYDNQALSYRGAMIEMRARQGTATNRKAGGYHCHRGSLAGQSFQSKDEMLQKLKTDSSKDAKTKSSCKE